MKLLESKQILYLILISLFFTQMFSSFLFNVNLLFAFYFLLKKKIAHKTFKTINKVIYPLPLFTFGLIGYNSFNNKNLLFYDNQLLFTLFNCNRESRFEYFQKFTLEKLECRSSIGFGIFEKYIRTSLDPFHSSILIAIFFILFLYFLLMKINEDEKFIFILFFVSPSFLMLFTSLNSDIFFFSHLLYIVVKRKTNFSIYDYLVITIFSQLKIFYIGLLFGIVLYKYLEKNRKELIVSLFFIGLNSFLFIFDFFTNTRSSYKNEIFGVPFVYAPMNTFGFVADLKTFFDVQLSLIENSKFVFLLVIVFVFIVLFFFKKNKFMSLTLNNEKIPLFIFSLPVCVMINLFGNAGYKFVFNFLPIFLLFNILNFNQIFYIYSNFYFIPIYAFLNLPNNHSMFSPSISYTSVWAYSRVNFYLTNILFIVIFINILRNYRKSRILT